MDDGWIIVLYSIIVVLFSIIQYCIVFVRRFGGDLFGRVFGVWDHSDSTDG